MVAEDVGAKRKIEQLLSDRDESLQEVKQTLQGMYFLFFFFQLRSFSYLFIFKKERLFADLLKKKFLPVLLWCFFSLFFPQGDWIGLGRDGAD